MSGESAGKPASGQGVAAGTTEGVWATFRQTPPVTKAILAGVFVNSLAAFIQIFLVLFLTHEGFSSSQASLALGLYGAGAVTGVPPPSRPPVRNLAPNKSHPRPDPSLRHV